MQLRLEEAQDDVLVYPGWLLGLLRTLQAQLDIVEKYHGTIVNTVTRQALKHSIREFDWSTVETLSIELLRALENIDAHHLGGAPDANHLGPVLPGELDRCGQ